MALTNIQIKKAKPKDKEYVLSAGKSIFLLVSPAGGKHWKYRYRIDGKAYEYAVGSYPSVTLADVLKIADDLKLLVKRGVHPKDKDKKEKQINTFQSVAESWIETKLNTWKPNHKKDVERSLLKHIYPYLGDIPVTDISTADVLHVLRKIESSGALVMLSKVNQRVSHIFAFACIEGMIKANPATNLQAALKSPVTTNFKHVPIGQLPELLRNIDDYDNITGVYVVTRLAMQLLSNTLIRTGELRHLKWSYIDFDKLLIEIPSEFMKMGNLHIVPLSSQSINILDDLKQYTGVYTHHSLKVDSLSRSVDNRFNIIH